MTENEALSYIHSAHKFRTHPTLEHVRTLLHALGDPQKDCRCVHIAGTNGKGSVSAMTDSILRAAGYHVGLFTSPFLCDFRERIVADGEMISGEELAEITERVKNAAEQFPEPPAEFELITVIGFEFFRRRHLDYVVLEVGLGGRLDPTNVIEDPVLSVITGIDFDHTALLGNTIQAIAAEKAGIIKSGRPSLFGGNGDSAYRTLCAVASAKGSPFHTVDRSRVTVREMTLDGTVLDFGDLTGLRLPLLGIYQPQNAATVLSAVELLRTEGVQISDDAVRNGLASVRWGARFEVLSSGDPTVIFDGAHNPQGIRAAVASIKQYFPDRKVLLVSGVMADKDYDGMIETLKPVAASVYAVTPDNPRALPAEEYVGRFHEHNISAQAFRTLGECLRAAVCDGKREQIPVVCLGSLYLYGPLKEELQQILSL